MKNWKRNLRLGAFAVVPALAIPANAFVVDTAALTTELGDVATNVAAIFALVLVSTVAVIGAKLGLRLVKSMMSKAV